MSLLRFVPAAAAAALLTFSTPAVEAQQAASPRDSVVTTIAGASLKLDYGRPSKRGREIFGGLVPWNRVWRTGANEATHLTTSKPLVFGSVTVPAGRYTLYTLPQQNGQWLLIINKQTGQWGTEYRQAEDLARIPLTVTQTPAVVEQFQLSITPSASGGELALSWDRTKAVTRFTIGN